MLLARLDLDGDRFADAAAAYAKAIAVSAKVARDATVWCEYADALGMTQGGSLSGKPRELIDHALTLEPTHGKALEMAGSAALEQGDFGAAAAYWRQLLAQLPAASPARRELAAAIARADQLAANSSPEFIPNEQPMNDATRIPGPDAPSDVLVIGAGISGLTAAFRLQQRATTVDVLEAAPRAGGVIGTRPATDFCSKRDPTARWTRRLSSTRCWPTSA